MSVPDRFVEIAAPPFWNDGGLPARLARALASPPDAPEARREIDGVQRAMRGVLHGLPDRDPDALLTVHQVLYLIYEASFANPLAPYARWEWDPQLVALRRAAEVAWLALERHALADDLEDAEVARRDGRFAAWFVGLAEREVGTDRRLVELLAGSASRSQMAWFVASDAYLNYRFYDALGLAQRHLAETIKLELSHHMWDECGAGVAARAHTAMCSRSLAQLGLELPRWPAWNDWRPFAGYNAYLLFGLDRAHHFKAVGSLAMPELFDSSRDRHVVRGLERLGLAQDATSFYAAHVESDEGHGPRWLEHVVMRLVALQPEAAPELALGGALRMQLMRRYNEYMLEALAAIPDDTSPEPDAWR